MGIYGLTYSLYHPQKSYLLYYFEMLGPPLVCYYVFYHLIQKIWVWQRSSASLHLCGAHFFTITILITEHSFFLLFSEKILCLVKGQDFCTGRMV